MTKKAAEAPAVQEDAGIYDWIEPTADQAKDMPLGRALSNAWMEYKEIVRTRTGNTGGRPYTYADHSDILKAVMPTLAKYQIEITHQVETNEFGRDIMMNLTVAVAKDGDERSITWPIGILSNKPQDNGANLTYARRYALSALLNIAPEDDTDGAGDGDRRDDRRDSRRDDRRDDRPRDNRRDERRDYRDEGPSREDPDSWRGQMDNGRGRNEGGRRREEPRNDEPAKLSKQAYEAIDMLESASNRASAKGFWDIFKKASKAEKGSPDYEAVAAVYARRWEALKVVEKKQDPLGLTDDKGGRREEPRREEKADKKTRPADPQVDQDPEHVSPDEAISRLEKMIEEAQTIVELDTLLKQHNRLVQIASEFPPDKEALNDMIEAARDAVGGDSAEDGFDDRDEDGSGDYEAPRADVGDERF